MSSGQDATGGPLPLTVHVSVPARGVLGVATAMFVALVAAAAIGHHNDFENAGLDFASFDQGLWLLSRFREPYLTTLGVNLFGDHSSFLLVPLAPVYWVAPDPAALLVVQSAALGLGAVGTFLIGRETLRSEWLACGVAVAYLLQPAVGWTGLDEFHPDAFEVPLLIFAIHFMLQRRWRPFIWMVVALLLVKEDVALLTFMLGLYVTLFHHRRVGLAVSGMSVVWLLAATFAILPAFNGVGTLDSWRVPFGGTGGLARATLTRPWDVIARLAGPSQREYLAQILLPAALLSFLSRPLLLVGIGPLLSNLLSTWPYQRDVQYHYSTLLVPIVIASAVLGIATKPTFARRSALVVAMVLASLVGSAALGPLSGEEPIAWSAGPEAVARGPAHEAIMMIPDDAAVSTMVQFAPHLGHREDLYLFPNPWRSTGQGDGSREGERLPAADRIDYILLTATFVDRYPGAKPVFEHLLEDGEFRTMFTSGGVVLLRRTTATP